MPGGEDRSDEVSRASSCQTVGLALRLHLEDEIEDDRLRAVSRLAQVRVLWNGERIHQLFLLPAEKKVIVPEDLMRSGGVVAPASNTGRVAAASRKLSSDKRLS